MKVKMKKKTSRESEKNIIIFYHYRSANTVFFVNFDQFCERINGGQTGSGLSHTKTNTRFVFRRSSALK